MDCSWLVPLISIVPFSIFALAFSIFLIDLDVHYEINSRESSRSRERLSFASDEIGIFIEQKKEIFIVLTFLGLSHVQ